VDDATRRALGAWYTPAPVVDHVLDTVLEPLLAARTAPDGLAVLDPACGDGRFLVAAAERIRRRFGTDPTPHLHGVDVDPAAVAATNRALGAPRAVVADGLTWDGAGPYDAVIGNPPFLGQLRARTARREPSGNGYADTAALFLDRALTRVRPDGGRVGLVLPQSVLATRDVAPVRARALDAAVLTGLWFAGEAVFDDATVHVVVLAFERGVTGRPPPVARWRGRGFSPAPPMASPDPGDPTWSTLVADLVGVPALAVTTGRRLGSLARATADFRDQYYGLVGAVSDEGDGPPLVTSGLIDPGRCRWGERPARFAKRTFRAPRVALGALSPAMVAWAASRLVPKVVVASQTPVLEAAVDADGAWLPSVPVITVTGADPWAVAAVLTSPVASAWLAARTLGTGLSAGALRPTAALLTELPLPERSWDEATRRLRDGDVAGAGLAVSAAYGIDAADEWWLERITPGSGSRRRRR